MIATDHVVFLHLHKSGGTFVNEGLLRFVPDARIIGYHLPRHLIPKSLAHLPVVGLVRNPWSYYVSWYSFQKKMAQPNPLFRILSDHGRLDFEATIRNMLDLGSGGACLDPLVAALPKDYTHQRPESAGFRAGADSRVAPRLLHVALSLSVRRSGDHAHRAHGSDARRAHPHAGVGGAARAGAVAFIHSGSAEAAIRPSTRRTRTTTATSSRSWCAERDAPLIQQFGYEFGK